MPRQRLLSLTTGASSLYADRRSRWHGRILCLFHEQVEVVFALQDLTWRGTSGCSINITSGSWRHMTPKWAFQRRVDGILRFAMSPASAPRASQAWHTAAPKRSDPVYVTSLSTSLRIRASQSLRRLGIAARLGTPFKPGASYLPVSSSCCCWANARMLPRPPSWWNGRPLVG